MQTKPLTSVHFLAVNGSKAYETMDQHIRDQFRHILDDAKRAHLRAVRDEWCRMFDIEKEESSDGEGGGRVSLTFPVGREWTEESATTFAQDILALDLSARYGGPGRYFQNSGIGITNDGGISIWVNWGLDI